MELRCAWVTKDPEYIEYHDKQWGRPVYDSRELFAKLCLDGQQAGLSWITILKRTESYYRAYADFDPVLIARFDEQDVERLMQDCGIIRNRLKVQSIIRNARAYLALQEQGIDFADYLWGFVGGAPIVNQRQGNGDIPATSPESDAMSKALKKLGFNFVGSTICYAFMQAVGMVNDHLVSCPCHAECQLPR
ncbi:DNA-3-methyladenine glycosylase I [Aeromonas veronii]